MGDIQPDALGFMAALETTNEPLEMCYSCQRALIYGAMRYASTAAEQMEEAGKRTYTGSLASGAIGRARQQVDVLMGLLAQFIRVDFHGAMPSSLEMCKRDHDIAIEAFYQARLDKYVAEDGTILRDKHNDDGEPDVFADPDDDDGGVTV